MLSFLLYLWELIKKPLLFLKEFLSQFSWFGKLVYLYVFYMFSLFFGLFDLTILGMAGKVSFEFAVGYLSFLGWNVLLFFGFLGVSWLVFWLIDDYRKWKNKRDDF